MKISLDKVSIVFHDWNMKDFSVDFSSGSFSSILGPSGCGKTTLLRLISGLEYPISGKIFFDDADYTFVSPENRNVGFVFQNDALFSHLDVRSNVAFGLEVRGEKNIDEKVDSALASVGLSGFGKRSIEHLSGGEKKRVAIARALAYLPKVLLLDEPFNGLDGNLRAKLKSLLKELQKKFGLTIIMATHDLNDALKLSDKIVVMNNGRIEQAGSPKEILFKPKTFFVRDFVSDVWFLK